MWNIQTFEVNMIQENCYIVSDETREAVIIDCGAFYPEEQSAIEQYIDEHQLTVKHLLNTHAHFDHILGNGALFRRYGLRAELNRADADLYDNLSLQVQSMMGRKLEVTPAPIAGFLKEGDVVTFGTHSLSVIETPGHTPGGLCFYCKEEKSLWSGDSLFYQSIGRTDFPGSDAFSLIDSLKRKVLTLPPDVIVYTGHGPKTSIETERRENIYLRSAEEPQA